MQALNGVFELRRLVAEDQQPAGGALAEEAVQRHRLGNGGDAEDAALLGGLDDIGAHPLGIDAGSLGKAGQDRLKVAAPISMAFWTM